MNAGFEVRTVGKAGMGQSQVMTPQLLQSIRLLQLSAQELDLELRQALESNVMLEESLDFLSGSAADDAVEAEVAPAVSPADGVDETRVSADFDWVDADAWSGAAASGMAAGGHDNDDDRSLERLGEAVCTDARLYALRQLADMVGSQRMAQLVAALIDEIDDNGYLRVDLSMMPSAIDSVRGITQDEWCEALALVQSVEPTGFGARNLRECLLLQLAELPGDTLGLGIARRVVQEQLELAVPGQEATLAALLDVPPALIRQAVNLIRGLNPKPGASMQADVAAAIPDLIISGQRGQWRVDLNPETLPRVRINYAYEACLKSRAGEHRAMRDQLSEARWLMRGLEMRYDTLLRTAQAIFGQQIRFLSEGESAVVPLNMKQVAEQIGMHESTVCRVVANKFVSTPWGVYPLRFFFPVQLASAAGEISSTAVRARLRRMIDSENTQRPYSDGELAAMLARDGIKIARRTVAKYREVMNVPPANLRIAPPAPKNPSPTASLRMAS